MDDKIELKIIFESASLFQTAPNQQKGVEVVGDADWKDVLEQIGQDRCREHWGWDGEWRE